MMLEFETRSMFFDRHFKSLLSFNSS